MRLMMMELQHRLGQLDTLGLLPTPIRRFLLDENIPGASSLLIVPQLVGRDFLRLLENPTRDSVDYWIRKGERSVWPAVCALKVRCAIEVELDRGYQVVRRRKPFDPASSAPMAATTTTTGVAAATVAGEGRPRKRRVGSFGTPVAGGMQSF